jgi:hypothetical protein
MSELNAAALCHNRREKGSMHVPFSSAALIQRKRRIFLCFNVIATFFISLEKKRLGEQRLISTKGLSLPM